MFVYKPTVWANSPGSRLFFVESESGEPSDIIKKLFVKGTEK